MGSPPAGAPVLDAIPPGLRHRWYEESRSGRSGLRIGHISSQYRCSALFWSSMHDVITSNADAACSMSHWMRLLS